MFIGWVLWKREWDLKDLVAVLFLMWSGLTVLWSPDWRQGLLDLQHLSALLAVFLIARRVEGPVWVAAAGLIVLTPFLNTTFNENIQAEVIALALPLFVTAPAWRIASFAAAGLALWALTAGTPSHMGWVALAVYGLLVLWHLKRPLVAPVVGLAIAAGLAAVVLIPAVRWEMLERLQFALGTSQMWATAPLWGRGLGSFDYLWPLFQNADRTVFPGLGYLGPNDSFIYPGYAHNDWLQLLAETGVIGLMLFLGLILVSFGPKWHQRAALTLFAVFMCGDFVLHNPETGLLAAVILGNSSPVSIRSLKIAKIRPILPVFAVLALFVLGFSGFYGVKAAKAEALYSEALCAQGALPGCAGNQLFAQGFVNTYRAFAEFPLDKRYRLEVARSFTRGFMFGRIKIDNFSLIQVWKISNSAIPQNAGLMMSRIYFLMATNDCHEECDVIVSDLRRFYPRLWETRKVLGQVHDFRVTNG